MNSSRGIVMFAFNNNSIDYLKLGLINALFIRCNMDREIPITIITNEYSIGWGSVEELGRDVSMIVLDGDSGLSTCKNRRLFRDTKYYSKADIFLNGACRVDAYSLSPYDETLLIDVDYFILADSLNGCWGSVEDFLMTKEGCHLGHGKFDSTEWRLNDVGIRNYWGAVIYFRKTERAESIFRLARSVKENWNYYSHVYGFPSDLYRNDFAFSIAIHCLSGFQESEVDVKPIVDSPMLISLDRDQVCDIIDCSTLLFFVKSLNDDWNFYCQKVSGINVHLTNKIAALNLSDKIIDTLLQKKKKGRC